MFALRGYLMMPTKFDYLKRVLTCNQQKKGFKLLCGTLLLLFTGICALAQNTTSSLAVKLEDETEAFSLLKKAAGMPEDTNRVNLLIKAAHIYWHQRTADNHGVDSCYLYAKQAYALSLKINYVTGRSEAAFLLCKVYTKKNTVEPALILARKAYGELRARLLLSIAEHYAFDFEPGQKEFVLAVPLIDEARRTARASRSDLWQDECSILTGKYQLKLGNVSNAKAAFMEVVNAAHRQKNYAREANGWSMLGNRMPEDDSTFRNNIYYHEQAVKYYLLAGQKKDAAYSLRDLAIVNGNYNQSDSSEQQLLRCVSLLKSVNERISIMTYTTLADFYRINGKYDKALAYAFEALNVKNDNQLNKLNTYIVLGRIYHLLKSYPEALKYYTIVFNYARGKNWPYQYSLATDIAHVTAESGEPQKALNFLSGFNKTSPPVLANFKQLVAATFADIYNQIGDYKKAESFYLKMLSYNAAVIAENKKNLDRINTTLSGAAGYYTIGKFYIQRKEYKKAKGYLLQSLQSQQYIDAEQKIDTDHLLFKADSALGNYLSAIRHFERQKTLYDSVNSVAKSRQISELNLKYETAKRLKDIKDLQNNQLIQKAKLQRADFIRNIILGGAVMFLLLALLAYNGYRSKKKANVKITAQREEIRLQYQTLQQLLAEKDNFIKEKDWLLKEIHHRVKNNLQIVMSLLSTQSAYLQNDDAIEAILESENRVQSIALIHQKLYNSDNLASISMPDYTADLILQLSRAFDTPARKIKILYNIEDIFIDLSQAVPLGLVLNEAITNSIKYAFGPAGGEISVTFKRTNPGLALLSVADNGKGLPPDFNISSTNSLGMEMMQGLSKQLKGTIRIETRSGTLIQMEFELMPTLQKFVSA